MSTLFPSIQPQVAEPSELPMYKEVKWDFVKNVPILQNGEPIFVTGLDAVLVWAWKALNTHRYRHEIYTWDYGCEVEALIGQNFSEDLKLSEASRYIKECLMINPYITDVTDIDVTFEDTTLKISCKIITI